MGRLSTTECTYLPTWVARAGFIFACSALAKRPSVGCGRWWLDSVPLHPVFEWCAACVRVPPVSCAPLRVPALCSALSDVCVCLA